jgi:hypothetical protein
VTADATSPPPQSSKQADPALWVFTWLCSRVTIAKVWPEESTARDAIANLGD